MKLKKCSHCAKDIPAQLSDCPYCHHSENGREITSTVENPSFAGDNQVKADLAQLGSEDTFLKKEAADRLSQKGPAIVPLLVSRLNEHAKGTSQTARLLGRFRDRRAVSA